MLAADYPLLDVFISIVLFGVTLIWLFAVAAAIIDIFRDEEMSGWAKAAWLLFVIFLPVIGLLSYLVVRGPRLERRALADDMIDATVARSTTADELTKLVDLRDRGALTESEFEKQKAVLLR